MRRTHFGRWGRVPLFDLYEDWREERQARIAQGINPRTGQPFAPGLLEAVQSGAPMLDRALVEAAPDTRADFATFLWGPVSFSFYQGYEYVTSQWTRYVGTEAIQSFDEVRIKGINGMTGIGYVGDHGEYQPMRRSFRPEAAIVVDTYGGVYSMTRKLLRSRGADVLVQRNPQDMGDAMADFISRMIVALIIANPNAPDGAPMYSTTRGNLVAQPLSEDTFVDAATWLRTQKDDIGRPIRVRLNAAVVQNDRQALIMRRIIRSQTTGVQAAPSSQTFSEGTDNPIAYADSDLMPADGIVIDPYIPDANNVYFFADPNRVPGFVAGFLDGQQQPLIGMTDATVMHLSVSGGNGHDPYSYEGDTIDYKTRHDVGVAAVDPRGVYQLNPA